MRSRLSLAMITAVALSALVACHPKQVSPALMPSTHASVSPSACSSLPTPRADAASYFEFDVEIPGAVSGGFPRVQRGGPVPGEILVQVVVSASGVPEMTTFRVLKASDQRLEPHARSLVATLRFQPAEIVRGCPVRQLVQEPFEFR